MKKYGLQLRAPPAQQKKQPQQTRPPPAAFLDDDDDDVEREIARHATKNKALKDIENQHKKALEEDPSVFDYDGVYDDMKQKIARPLAQDRQERKPKYIQKLMEKAKEREREHEVIYERKLAKERSKDDHLFVDKEKFVTSAYKKKLAEQAKWLEEERLRQLHEEKNDVTKKSDLSDFYFNLTKNVAFGGESAGSRNPMKREAREADDNAQEADVPVAEALPHSIREERESNQEEAATSSQKNSGSSDEKPTSQQETVAAEQQVADETALAVRYKRSEDALAAVKERYLARKKARQ
ncbi:uncharacterized protein LOC131252330 [Magnolia sinica]|uniref:uncharacterized protein LOC131252330 n=1 Tax=Magnolia sinica TaxID=86752 RepID=UPI00265827D1|nr:uncharacterized protein LOC131252330 [Magnolia sinica]